MTNKSISCLSIIKGGHLRVVNLGQRGGHPPEGVKKETLNGILAKPGPEVLDPRTLDPPQPDDSPDYTSETEARLVFDRIGERV